MSEHWYYEFQAIDRLLTDDEQKALRRYSGRAMITATRFVSRYSYGDFRGSPGPENFSIGHRCRQGKCVHLRSVSQYGKVF